MSRTIYIIMLSRPVYEALWGAATAFALYFAFHQIRTVDYISNKVEAQEWALAGLNYEICAARKREAEEIKSEQGEAEKLDRAK